MAKLRQTMNDNQIIHQHRMISSEWVHVKRRLEAGEIEEEEWRNLNQHLNTELERLTHLYRGWPWPVAESEESNGRE